MNRPHVLLSLTSLIVGLCLTPPPLVAGAVDYDVVYVRQPRYGDLINTIWPEIFHPARAEPGADLVLLHPDGTEEILVDCDAISDGCSVTDPFISFDGTSVYYSLFYDLRDDALNYQRKDLPYFGADIFRMHLATRVVTRLTFGEFTPNTGAGNWDETNPLNPPSEFNRLGYGILNLGASPLPGGKIIFTSNRNGFWPIKAFTSPTMQLYVMDEDGKNVTPIAPMTLNSALHPVVLRDGRVMFSSYESQALRDRRLWGIWTIYPDGRNWAPLISAFRQPQAFHFATQLSDENLVVTDYYNLNNNGFGAFYRFPVSAPPGVPAFGSPFPSLNPEINRTTSVGLFPFRMRYTPFGMYSITPMTHAQDNAAPVGQAGPRVGKFTHPSAAPNGDLLAVWTPGPANDLMRPINTPRYDAGLYLMPEAGEIWDPTELVELKNDPNYNEAWPRAVVPYSAVHGVNEPALLPWLPEDGTLHSDLPVGTPYGLIGTSSFYKRESFPGTGEAAFDGLDPFNTSQNGASSNWGSQGADAGKYSDSEIWAVRLVALEPNTHRSYGPNNGTHFFNHVNERHRILGEVPLRKFDDVGTPILDPEGNPDTSFLAKIPADTPFTFQTIDRNGVVLNMAQTWHQVRPGEVRTDCGGCHAHSQLPLAFDQTAAGQAGFTPSDLTQLTALVTHDAQGAPDLRTVQESLVDIEFYQDIRPLLQRSCLDGCHSQNQPAPDGNLVLDDLALDGDLPGDYRRLCADSGANWGYPPVISNGIWRQTNASRYVRPFQARRSMLTWKIFGERLDGWSNAAHPTESVLGDASTLPSGANANDADIDFTGTIMPPVGSAVPALSIDEKMTFARWIDLGCPIDTGATSGSPNHGWFLDDLRPTLHVSSPKPGFNPQPITMFRFGLADANSGIDLPTLSITADFVVEGRAAGAALADLAISVAEDVWAIQLGQPLGSSTERTVRFEIQDVQGNTTRVERTFSTVSGDAIFVDGFELGDLSAWF